LLFFLKAGALTFGSGLVIVPFLEQGLVRDYGWLDQRQFLIAVGVLGRCRSDISSERRTGRAIFWERPSHRAAGPSVAESRARPPVREALAVPASARGRCHKPREP